MKHTIHLAALAAACITTSQAAVTITYEDANLGALGYINNAPYSTAGVTHSNSFTEAGANSYWSGFALSNHTDTTTLGPGNQYSSYTGSGAGGSAQYAVGFTFDTTGTVLTFSATVDATGMSASFANTTYTALDMLNGSMFSEKFGGISGNDPDYMKLTLTGYLNNIATGTTELYLADYRFADNSQDYILNVWTPLSFAPLGTAVDRISFTIEATDWGTPTYFAMDNLVVPEPSASALLAAGVLGLASRRRRI